MNRRKFVMLMGAAAAGAVAEKNRGYAAAAQERWRIGPFVRPADGRPIIRPNPSAVFTDPNTRRLSRWEFAHTFNPAAIAWKDNLYVLFRAEGEHGDDIGGYTSRVGLAESSDGVEFTELPHPVLYPQPGRWQKDEWPGDLKLPNGYSMRCVSPHIQWIFPL